MMTKADRLTKVLALIGTALVWFPIAVTILLSAIGTIGSGIFLFDFLMPAELFPAALVGGMLLIWAALRARSRVRPIGLSLALTVGLLVGSQAIAVATGLASGRIEPTGWPWVLVIAVFAGFLLALLALAVAGVLLARDLFRE